MKTQLQFLLNTFLLIVEYNGGILKSLDKSVVTMFFLCGTIFFSVQKRCLSVKWKKYFSSVST